MAGERKSVGVKDQILELARRGIGKKKIAQSLGISKNTVVGIIRGSQTMPHESAEEGNDGADQGWVNQVSWGKVIEELKKPYATIKCLHAEYAPEGITYLRFWRELKRKIPDCLEDQVRIRFQYKPGSRVEIDYCDGVLLTDPKSGATKKTHLFAGVSACSDYVFGEFVMSQKRNEFIASQERMFHFFGGVFEYLIVDNLKSGVHRAHLYDPDINPVYVDYANHQGFTVLPARPRTPRDKPAIEGAIGVIQRQFFAEARNEVFYSLTELNVRFRDYLGKLNTDVMKDYGVSRADRFATEIPYLKPLPLSLFEISEYRMAKVHPDCHIQVDKNFYSVPFPFIGQTLRVRLTPRLVEIFNSDHDSIALHTRSEGKGIFTTHNAHYPEQKLAAVRFDILAAKREAERCGPEMRKVVEELLSGNSPLRYLRRIQGILRLRKIYSSSALEYGCHQALIYNRLRLAYIEDCAKKFELGGHRPRLVGAPERDPSSVYLHSNLKPT